MWGHSQTRVRGGGGARHVGGGGGATYRCREVGGDAIHSSIESSESEEGGGAVQQRLELPTSCMREGGGAVQRQLELPTSWHKGR
jgi:hypothetical protein